MKNKKGRREVNHGAFIKKKRGVTEQEVEVFLGGKGQRRRGSGNDVVVVGRKEALPGGVGIGGGFEGQGDGGHPACVLRRRQRDDACDAALGECIKRRRSRGNLVGHGWLDWRR